MLARTAFPVTSLPRAGTKSFLAALSQSWPPALMWGTDDAGCLCWMAPTTLNSKTKAWGLKHQLGVKSFQVFQIG